MLITTILEEYPMGAEAGNETHQPLQLVASLVHLRFIAMHFTITYHITYFFQFISPRAMLQSLIFYCLPRTSTDITPIV